MTTWKSQHNKIMKQEENYPVHHSTIPVVQSSVYTLPLFRPVINTETYLLFNIMIVNNLLYILGQYLLSTVKLYSTRSNHPLKFHLQMTHTDTHSFQELFPSGTNYHLVTLLHSQSTDLKYLHSLTW